MSVQPWIKGLVGSVMGTSSMAIGKRLRHPDGYMVKVVGGQYWGEYGLSNFWEWRRVGKHGRLSRKVECGYGW